MGLNANGYISTHITEKSKVLQAQLDPAAQMMLHVTQFLAVSLSCLLWLDGILSLHPVPFSILGHSRLSLMVSRWLQQFQTSQLHTSLFAVERASLPAAPSHSGMRSLTSYPWLHFGQGVGCTDSMRPLASAFSFLTYNNNTWVLHMFQALHHSLHAFQLLMLTKVIWGSY